MFNSTYGAGYRAGMMQPKTQSMQDGTKILLEKDCPFPGWRFISHGLWMMGYFDGITKRISQILKGTN